MEPKLITVGRVLTTHGTDGEDKVLPLTDFPERFHRLQWIYLEKDECLEKAEIISVRFHKNQVIVKFKGINDISSAERLRNALIRIEREHAMPLPAGHYYVFELIGLPVFTEEEEYLGEVKDIFPTGSNDVYQVVHPQSGQEILLPAIKECILSIDLSRKKILVRMLPGLRD